MVLDIEVVEEEATTTLITTTTTGTITIVTTTSPQAAFIIIMATTAIQGNLGAFLLWNFSIIQLYHYNWEFVGVAAGVFPG